MNLSFHWFANNRCKLFDRICVSLFVLINLSSDFLFDIDNLLEVKLLKNFLPLISSTSDKRLVIIKFEHDVVISLVLDLDSLDSSIDDVRGHYMDCFDLLLVTVTSLTSSPI